jgi:hypothetical protein
MRTWNSGWQRTSLPGVYVRGDACRIRVRITDRRSGRRQEANRIIHNVTSVDAAERRQSLRSELEARLREPPRRRVAEFGRYWLAIKRAVIDPGTYERYKAALEDHAFECFGRMGFAELRGLHVQNWINEELARQRLSRLDRQGLVPRFSYDGAGRHRGSGPLVKRTQLLSPLRSQKCPPVRWPFSVKRVSIDPLRQ